MMRINLIGDYEGRYRISVVEWVLLAVNVVLLMGFIAWAATLWYNWW